MKIRIYKANSYCTRAVLALEERGDKTLCLTIEGWSTNKKSHKRIRMCWALIPTRKLSEYFSPERTVMIYKQDVLGVDSNGRLHPLTFWKGDWPEGWDLRRYGHNSYIGRPRRQLKSGKVILGRSIFNFRQVPNGWVQEEGLRSEPTTKWGRLKKAPTSGWYKLGQSDYDIKVIKRLTDVAAQVAASLGLSVDGVDMTAAELAL